MNHGQKPVTVTSDSHKRLSRLTTVVLVLALAGAVLGSAALVIEVWWIFDEVAAASSPADTGAQTTR
jgi:hypothetical protein